MNSGADIANLMGLARTAELAGNNEEALTYFNRVLEIDPTVSEAWMGKGKAAGWQSSLQNIRTNEALIAFGHSVANAPADQKANVTREAIDEANKLVVAIYTMARNQLDEFAALDDTWPSYLHRVSILLAALEQIRTWDPTDRITLENIIHLCKDNMEGVSYRNFDNTPNVGHVSPEYEAKLRAQLESAANDLRTLDPSYQPPAIEKKKADACFVVTATMGDEGHPTVTLMRRFRDEKMLKTSLGRQFITAYYRFGPKAAALVGKSTLRRRLSYFFIVAPAAKGARFFLSKK